MKPWQGCLASGSRVGVDSSGNRVWTPWGLRCRAHLPEGVMHAERSRDTGLCAQPIPLSGLLEAGPGLSVPASSVLLLRGPGVPVGEPASHRTLGCFRGSRDLSLMIFLYVEP